MGGMGLVQREDGLDDRMNGAPVPHSPAPVMAEIITPA